MPKQKPNEQVQQIPLSEIRPFKNHPFKVTDDELMQQTIDSIMQVGVLNPAIIRPAPEGGYEMVAGHRRLHAADLAGLKTIPAIVRNLDDDEAVILMVDSNLQRETISPMERAQAYKMKLEALKHQGKRVDLEGKSTSRQLVGKLETADKVGELAGDSGRQVQRYIYRRGDVYLANLDPYIGSEQGGTRPVVVLQNNTGNYYCPTLIIAPITSKAGKKPSQPTHYYAERIHGLELPGMVLLEQIKTIDKRRVKKYLGRMTRQQMDEIGEAIEEALGLYVPEEMEAP